MSDRSARLGIEYDVPPNFVESEADGLYIVGDPENEIGFFIKRCAAGQAEQAIYELDAMLSQFFQGVQTSGPPVPGQYNGIPATDVQATATFQGQPCLLNILWLQLSPEALAVVIGAVLTARKDRWKETFTSFLGGIRSAV
jgi:hypothetical protein